MEFINRYLNCPYEDGARGPDKYDCWGLTRHVRHFEQGKKLLPSYGSLRNSDPRGFTKAYEQEAEIMELCEPEDGAIAAVLIGRICVHVGLVVACSDGLRILEVNPKRGPRSILLHKWMREHIKVTFHRDIS